VADGAQDPGDSQYQAFDLLGAPVPYFTVIGLANFTAVAERLLNQLAIDCDVPGGRKNTRGCLNAYLSPLAGGVLFLSDGRVDARRLETLLGKIDIQPETPMLGTTAQLVFKHSGQTFVDYAYIYKHMVETYGRDRLKKDYLAARKQHGKPGDDTDYNDPMMQWYYKYAEQFDQKIGSNFYLDPAASDLEQGVRSEGIVAHRSHQLYVPVGFWLRRIADGSDQALYAFMTEQIRRHEPELHEKHFQVSPRAQKR
jgi:hypothetical protein